MSNFKIVFIAASTLLMTACIVQPLPPHGAYDDGYGYGDDTVVDVAPPPPYVEPIPVAPFLGAIWVGGYWGWSSGRHVWYPGHYMHARNGYVYHQAGWNRDGYGRYHFRRGGWSRH